MQNLSTIIYELQIYTKKKKGRHFRRFSHLENGGINEKMLLYVRASVCGVFVRGVLFP